MLGFWHHITRFFCVSLLSIITCDEWNESFFSIMIVVVAACHLVHGSHNFYNAVLYTGSCNGNHMYDADALCKVLIFIILPCLKTDDLPYFFWSSSSASFKLIAVGNEEENYGIIRCDSCMVILWFPLILIFPSYWATVWNHMRHDVSPTSSKPFRRNKKRTVSSKLNAYLAYVTFIHIITITFAN